MLHKLKACALALIAFGFTPHRVAADEALMSGVRPFICDGEAFVLFEDDDGWKIPTYSTAKVKRTDNGWRLEDTYDGRVMYLREESDYSWVADRVSEEGHTKLDCVDLADSVSQVVTIIKPRLDEGIVETQQDLTEATTNLGIAEKKNLQLIADHRAEISRVTTDHIAQMTLAKQALEQAVQSKEELVGRIDNSKKLVSINKENYNRLLQAAILMPNLGGELKKLKDAPPSERNSRIEDSSLGSKGLAGEGLVPICVKLLRDKADLNEACQATLTEFVLLEGWE